MKQKNYSVCPYWDKSALDEKTKQSRIMITINNVGSHQFQNHSQIEVNKIGI